MVLSILINENKIYESSFPCNELQSFKFATLSLPVKLTKTTLFGLTAESLDSLKYLLLLHLQLA